MAELFPHLAQLRIIDVQAAGPVVRIDPSTLGGAAACPECRWLSRRVHSRYERRLSDTAIAGREVLIRLRARKLFCDNSDCGRRIFAEPNPALAARHARRTTMLQRLLCAVALALGGRAGARMTRHLTVTVSRMTLLRQIRALPDPDRGSQSHHSRSSSLESGPVPREAKQRTSNRLAPRRSADPSAWLGKYRRLSKDYEYQTVTSETSSTWQ
ncbi:transposase family protein [Nocardia terpenica]|uniref:transposase family protein n=1 Tax=Nocardia terpenica TaxID=455432 RepID=UPI0009EE6C07|nr:transposase family protein [Nocardia terpenica]NQE91217.1 transposase family protein [Nocardia terpenica]